MPSSRDQPSLTPAVFKILEEAQRCLESRSLLKKYCSTEEGRTNLLNFFLLQQTTVVTKKFSEAAKKKNANLALPSCQCKKARAVAEAGKSLKDGRGSESENK